MRRSITERQPSSERAGASVSNWRGAEIGGDLAQPFPQRVANIGEHLGAGFTQLLFSGRRDASDDVARLAVQRSNRSEHPLVGHALKPRAKVFGGFLAKSIVETLHFPLVGFRHR